MRDVYTFNGISERLKRPKDQQRRLAVCVCVLLGTRLAAD